MVAQYRCNLMAVLLMAAVQGFGFLMSSDATAGTFLFPDLQHSQGS